MTVTVDVAGTVAVAVAVAGDRGRRPWRLARYHQVMVTPPKRIIPLVGAIAACALAACDGGAVEACGFGERAGPSGCTPVDNLLVNLDERLQLANELYCEYHTRCFWHCPRDLAITEELIPLVVKGLRAHGGRQGFILASKLLPDATHSS